MVPATYGELKSPNIHHIHTIYTCLAVRLVPQTICGVPSPNSLVQYECLLWLASPTGRAVFLLVYWALSVSCVTYLKINGRV